MPTNIKLLLSILVVVVSGTMFHFQRDLENIMPSYASLFVGLLMILGMWIFPDVRKENPADPKRPPAGSK
jgi:hypothetical protein